MTADDIIQKAYKYALGDDENISQNDSSYGRYLEIADTLQRDWANEPLTVAGERWASLEREIKLDAPDDGSAINLPKDAIGLAIRPLSGRKMMIVKIEGNNEEIVIKLHGLNAENFAIRDSSQAVYFYDYANKRVILKPEVMKLLRNDGHKLVFTYYKNTTKLSPSSLIEVDNPNWLIYMLAAEIARTDTIQSGQYGNLVAMAQNVMGSMIRDQRKLRFEIEKPNTRGAFYA